MDLGDREIYENQCHALAHIREGYKLWEKCRYWASLEELEKGLDRTDNEELKQQYLLRLS